MTNDNETEPMTLDEMVRTANIGPMTLETFRKIIHDALVRTAKHGYLYKANVDMLVKGNNIDVLVGSAKK
jgi:hypothetical protein